jgi:hypothetical protein
MRNDLEGLNVTEADTDTDTFSLFVTKICGLNQNGHNHAANWQEKFDRVLTRLYTLRNQIIHGGAT